MKSAREPQTSGSVEKSKAPVSDRAAGASRPKSQPRAAVAGVAKKAALPPKGGSNNPFADFFKNRSLPQK